MRKLLSTTILEGRTALLLDNFSGHLHSAALEAFVSGFIWEHRILGSNQSIKTQTT
jgi:hypothetical protein